MGRPLLSIDLLRLAGRNIFNCPSVDLSRKFRGERSVGQAIEKEKNGFRNRQGADLLEFQGLCSWTFRSDYKSRGYNKVRGHRRPEAGNP